MHHAAALVSNMPPHDRAMGCPTKKFQYGKDCICENPIQCRGLTAAFSMLNDPRSHFVRLPNYKAAPTDPYFVERNQQREAYLRYLLPHHPVEQTTLARDVALHHFHPRIVARLVSKMQKNIPKSLTEKELKRLKLTIHERDRILDQEGNYTGRCIFAPNYPMEQSKQDLKRLLRLCRTLNEASAKEKKNVDGGKASSPKPKKRKRRKFHADIRNERDLVVHDGTEDGSESTDVPTDEHALVDSLAEHNIQSLLESIIRLEPIPEYKEESTLDVCNLKEIPTQDTEVESECSSTSAEEQGESSVMHTQAIVSMQIRLEKLHTGKGKKRMSKLKAPSPFFEISVLHNKENISEPALKREVIYRSYPLVDTKNATWEPIHELHLHVDIHGPQDLNFQVTVYDCDLKGGNHLLIGTCEVNALDLLITSSMSVPIRRDEKLKGFLEISHFQLHTDEQNETLEDDSVESSSQVAESISNDTAAASESVSDNVAESNIQQAHPESPPTGVKTRLEFDSPATSIKEVSVVTPDESPVSSPTRITEEQSPTCGDGEEITHNQQEDSFEKREADLSSIVTLSMPTLSMQVSLEKLHTGKGKKSFAGKLMNKAPSPFFDFAVLHQDEHSSQWETLYQSYPLPETRNGTWELVEDLNLGVLVDSSEDLSFRITVYDCDMKGGNHSLIGIAQVKASELHNNNNITSISIKRGDKVKGTLRFDRFEMDWSA